jgi:hypothetical protein
MMPQVSVSRFSGRVVAERDKHTGQMKEKGAEASCSKVGTGAKKQSVCPKALSAGEFRVLVPGLKLLPFFPPSQIRFNFVCSCFLIVTGSDNPDRDNSKPISSVVEPQVPQEAEPLILGAPGKRHLIICFLFFAIMDIVHTFHSSLVSFFTISAFC